jgi:hypothetical protein
MIPMPDQPDDVSEVRLDLQRRIAKMEGEVAKLRAALAALDQETEVRKGRINKFIRAFLKSRGGCATQDEIVKACQGAGIAADYEDPRNDQVSSIRKSISMMLTRETLKPGPNDTVCLPPES